MKAESLRDEWLRLRVQLRELHEHRRLGSSHERALKRLGQLADSTAQFLNTFGSRNTLARIASCGADKARFVELAALKLQTFQKVTWTHSTFAFSARDQSTVLTS